MHQSSVRRGLLALSALVALALPATASADRLVIPGGPTFKTTGSETIAFDGHVYFAADDGVHGNELWRTDGTAEGTTLVQDIRPGDASSRSDPSNFLVVGNRLLFQVNTNGTDSVSLLYYLDQGGTPQQPTLPGGGVAHGSLFGVVNGKAMISSYHADGGQFGNYDVLSLGDTGSALAVVSSGDFDAARSGPLDQGDAATIGGYIYFPGIVGTNYTITPNRDGSELYRTDGTSQPTLVKDIRTGGGASPLSSSPREFTATSNHAYFIADDGSSGQELWVTDGTNAGTHLVRDHATGPALGTVFSRTASGDALYYVPLDSGTGAEVWRTDEVGGGTRVVKDITPGAAGVNSMQVFAFGSGLGFFRGNDVYGSDGTDTGTNLLATADSDGIGPLLPRAVGGRAYFRAGFSPYGSVLWRTDGTAAGTFALTAGAFDGTAGGNPDVGPVTPLGSKLIFTARFPGDSTFSQRRVYVIDTTQPDGPRLSRPVTGTPPPVVTTPKPGVAPTPPVGGPKGGSTTPKKSLSLGRKAKLRGSARIGQRIRLTLPKFRQKKVKLSFRWYANKKAIKKQTKSSLKVTKRLKGKRITLKITARKPGYKTRTFTLRVKGTVR